MVKITEELIRKKSEHNECIIGTLEELSLHQEDVEKIEHINNWCKELQILYLQSNLISKIENLHKLKKLQYLNLAINNIERVENLERCESLKKLDLTLNFIGDLESVSSLKKNIHLEELFLTGNPCTDFEGYRNYVIAKLPQLKSLDNIEICRSERIKAIQILPELEKDIKEAQHKYTKFRQNQRNRLSCPDTSIDDDTFWKSTSEHAPETRYEISRRSRLARGKDAQKGEEEKKPVSIFAKNGRPLNINQAKIKFRFDDSDPEMLVLDITVYRYLDTSYIEVDLQPIYVRVCIKGKVFQYVFPEEILTDRSTAQRSQTTGHLVLKMPRANYKPEIKLKKRNIKSQKTETQRNEFLEVKDAKDSMDFSKIIENNDHSEVPPLEFG